MKFFNKKEQVIDLQLTQFGKRLLSKGRFKPVYYAFFDDGILYDSQYGGYTEIQNEAQNRIISDTPQLETQYVFAGIEAEIKRVNEYIRSSPEEKGYAPDPGVMQSIDQAQFFQSDYDKQYALTSMLGTSALISDKMPAWEINFVSGKISGSVNFQNTGSCAKQAINIPELKAMPITYETRIDSIPSYQADDFAEGEGQYVWGNDVINVFEDDAVLILQIDEKNTDFLNKNFDIEVFKITSGSNPSSLCDASQKQETLIPLYFTKKVSSIENGIIKDEDEIEAERGELEEMSEELVLDNTYVEYFFDVLVDNEIPKDIICAHVKNDGKGMFSQRALDCKDYDSDLKTQEREELYATDISADDAGECP